MRLVADEIEYIKNNEMNKRLCLNKIGNSL